uniref:Sulfatase N-terminal domain-containing protein n=2 Tax=Trichogramma kaykai TaxID=54128 RepID=A0ABD2XNR8_9HYME
MFRKIAIILGLCTIINSERPHIILIVADDVGWNDLSFHGSDQIPTPNIDALAYNGIILNRHYALPICTPSRTALMTGRYPIRAGMQGWPLSAGEARSVPRDTTLMPEHFRRLGYRTGLVGKWHLGYSSEDLTPARRGFDTFFGYYNGYIGYYDHDLSERIDNVTVKGRDVHEDGPEVIAAADRVSGYFTDVITDRAVREIRRYGRDGDRRPLFLEIAHLAGHASEAEESLEVRDMAEVNATFGHIKDIKRRRYAGMIRAMDESVGEVVRALGESGMLDNSVIVFLSDNGAPTVNIYPNSGSNYPFRGVKNTLWEGGVRTAACIFSPLIVPRAMRRDVDDDDDRMMHVVDWLPTLYAAAGGDPSADLINIDGLDQWSWIVGRNNAGTARRRRNSVLLNIDEKSGAEAAIINNYKLLRRAVESTGRFFGDSGDDQSYPTYSLDEALLGSQAARAINQIDGFARTRPSRARELRARARLACRPPPTPTTGIIDVANCQDSCLFDLANDPCETRDLSGQMPEKVEALKQFIDGYRRVLVPQTNVPLDPNADPKYFNGTWMPWL